jgi:hypothetical protein
VDSAAPCRDDVLVEAPLRQPVCRRPACVETRHAVITSSVLRQRLRVGRALPLSRRDAHIYTRRLLLILHALFTRGAMAFDGTRRRLLLISSRHTAGVLVA